LSRKHFSGLLNLFSYKKINVYMLRHTLAFKSDLIVTLSSLMHNLQIPKLDNTLCQFHQHYMPSFFVQIFCQSKNVIRNVTREKLPNRRSYEKFVRKMLMKLTPYQHAEDFFIYRVCIIYFLTKLNLSMMIWF